MNSKTWIRIIALVLFAALAIPVSLTAQENDTLGPQYNRGNDGYCEEQNGVLTGYCAAFVSQWGYCSAQPSPGCSSGQKAKQPGTYDCYGFHQYSADFDTQCSFSINSSDFLLSAAAFSPPTVNPGSVSTSAVDVTAFGGFNSAVALTCTVAPTPALAPACSITPSTVMPATAATLTVSTTAPTSGDLSSGRSTGLLYALCLPLVGLLASHPGVGSRQYGKRKIMAALLAGILFVVLVFQLACGGSSSMGPPSPGTPAGPYTITVTGDSGAIMNSTSIMLTVQ